jgi:hypothetical protein
MAQQAARTVRVTIDLRTYEPDDLIKVLRSQKDGLGDHFTAVVLPSMGFDGKAQAGGSVIHEHEPEDRPCRALFGNDRIWRDDGQDEL